MFGRSRIARIIIPLVIIAIVVAAIMIVENNKTEIIDSKKNGETIVETIKGTCSLEVECKELLNKKNEKLLDSNLKKFIPKNGEFVNEIKVPLYEQDTVFSVLKRVLKENNISIESSTDPTGVYVEGIGNFYEFSCGKQSGWVYTVNGKDPGVSSNETTVNPNDKIVWHYTCTGQKQNRG